jgi:hypothetical protein
MLDQPASRLHQLLLLHDILLTLEAPQFSTTYERKWPPASTAIVCLGARLNYGLSKALEKTVRQQPPLYAGTQRGLFDNGRPFEIFQ